MESEVPRVSAAAVPAELGESVVLLDVRDHDEWQRGQAPGAQHIPTAARPLPFGREVPPRVGRCRSPGRHRRWRRSDDLILVRLVR
jgi:rhodanese-related sulfurtransferase